MSKIFAEGFDGIKIILAESESAGGGRGPGIDQSHLNDIESLRSRAQIGAAISNVNVNLRPLVEVLRIIGIAAAHDGFGDDGIDLDSSDAGAAIRDGSQNVDAAPGPNNGEGTLRTQNVSQSRWRRHEIFFPFGVVPVGEIAVHDVGGSVG